MRRLRLLFLRRFDARFFLVPPFTPNHVFNLPIVLAFIFVLEKKLLLERLLNTFVGKLIRILDGRVFKTSIGRVFKTSMGRVFKTSMGRVFKTSMGRVFKTSMGRVFKTSMGRVTKKLITVFDELLWFTICLI